MLCFSWDALPAGHVARIDDRAGIGDPQDRVVNRITNEFTLLCEPAGLQNTRDGDFHRLLGELDLVLPGPAWIADRRQLVNPSEGRLIVGGGEARPDSP